MIGKTKEMFKVARKLRKQQKKIQEAMMNFPTPDKLVVLEYQKNPEKKEILDKLSDESKKILERVTRDILE